MIFSLSRNNSVAGSLRGHRYLLSIHRLYVYFSTHGAQNGCLAEIAGTRLMLLSL